MYKDPMTEMQATNLNCLTLAYIGDTIYEDFVRELIVLRHPGMSTQRLHKAGVSCVNCKAQAKILEQLEPLLSEKEQNIVRRGRNSKPGSFPKNADAGDYLRATAFESLIGFLYITGNEERLREILKACENTIIELTEKEFGRKYK